MTTEQNKKYNIKRECSNCGQITEIEVSKRESAFDLYDINKSLGLVCNKCKLTNFITYFDKPELDFELLKEWAKDPDLSLMEQDEDLIIAEAKYLEIILNVLDNEEILLQKNNILIEALCVIIYDNSVEGNEKPDNDLKKRVIEELNKRQDKLKLAEGWIMDYIKVVVYPQLQIE